MTNDLIILIREKNLTFFGRIFQWLAGQVNERMKLNPCEAFYKTGANVANNNKNRFDFLNS